MRRLLQLQQQQQQQQQQQHRGDKKMLFVLLEKRQISKQFHKQKSNSFLNKQKTKFEMPFLSTFEMYKQCGNATKMSFLQ